MYFTFPGLDPGFSGGGGAWTHFGGGFGLQRGHFLVKIYAKMKELGPVGGRAPGTPPPRSAYGFVSKYQDISGLYTLMTNL